MKECKKCGDEKPENQFYANDKSCKECRKAAVRANRAAKIDYYREYDRKRANRPDRVAARKAYQKTEAGIAAGNKAKMKWCAQNPAKRAASYLVNNAVRDGRIEKPARCQECGATGRIHGHHDDYAKPLEVRWLCSKCHWDWHKENGEGDNA